MSLIRHLPANTAITNADVILIETRGYRPALSGAPHPDWKRKLDTNFCVNCC
jgi:hypothetical protein